MTPSLLAIFHVGLQLHPRTVRADQPRGLPLHRGLRAREHRLVSFLVYDDMVMRYSYTVPSLFSIRIGLILFI